MARLVQQARMARLHLQLLNVQAQKMGLQVGMRPTPNRKRSLLNHK